MSNKTLILEQYDRLHSLYQRFALDVEFLLKRILLDESISYNAITCRLKERDSLSQKIDRKNDKYSDISELTDVAGIRVITYYADDVDRIAELVEREFEIDRENSIDKRKALEPDRFGYCSVHYVVQMHPKRLRLKEYNAYKGLKCEIQIRSVLQHAWAEIEHDLGYKSSIAVPREIRRNFSRLAGLLEIADEEFQEIRQRLTSYKIEVQNKINEENFIDTEIDAVSLETLIKTNSDIQEMNSIISNCFGSTVNYNDLKSEQLVFTINLLKYFQIVTLEQLLDSISKNKKLAIYIANSIINKESDDKYSDNSSISSDIAFFYLCYAELISKENVTEDDIINYLSANNISDRNSSHETIAKEFLQIKSDYLKQN